MLRFIELLKAACLKLFTGFVANRLLAELPGADELIQIRRDHQSDDPRTGGGFPAVGVL